MKRKDPITSVKLISTEMDDEFIGEHGIRLDLVAKTSSNEILNIEMQKKNDDNMYKRSLFYWAKLYSSQLTRGQKYEDLRPVIAINILDFNLFKNDNRCQRHFLLKDAETNEEHIRMIEMQFVELNKRKHINQNDDLWMWVEFLKTPNSGYMELLCEKAKLSTEVNETVRSVADAKKVYDKAIADPVEKEKIRLLEKTQLDNFSSIAKAKEEGLEKGKLENQKQIALNMRNQGFDEETITKCLDISINDLRLLLNSKKVLNQN